MEKSKRSRQGIRKGASHYSRRQDIPEPTTQRKSKNMIAKIRRFFKRQRRLARRYPIAYGVRVLVLALILIGLITLIRLVASAAGQRSQEELKTTAGAATVLEVPEPTEATPTEAPTEAPSSLIYSYDWSADDAYMMARMAMAEAEGEDTEGKALVILVILNRAWSDGFPDSIEGVITQRNAFTSYHNGRYDRVEPDADCWKALQMVEQGWDESQGATFFEVATDADTWHNTHLETLFTHGAHTFYKEKQGGKSK